MESGEKIEGFIPGYLLILLITFLLAFVGWMIWNNNDSEKKNNSSNTTLESGWKEYKNSKYNISFAYRPAWGVPDIYEQKSDQGKRYSIGFTKESSSPIVRLAIDADDVVIRSCSQDGKNCDKINGFSQEDIKKALSEPNKKSLLKYGDDFYSVLRDSPTGTKDNSASELRIYKITSLPTINASAVKASYSVFTKGTCGAELVAKTTKNCITQSQYDDLYKLAISLKSI